MSGKHDPNMGGKHDVNMGGKHDPNMGGKIRAAIDKATEWTILSFHQIRISMACFVVSGAMWTLTSS